MHAGCVQERPTARRHRKEPEVRRVLLGGGGVGFSVRASWGAEPLPTDVPQIPVAAALAPRD
jgi:hypothetical protein